MSKNRSETYKLEGGGTLHIDYVIEPIVPKAQAKTEHYAHPRFHVEWDGYQESDFQVIDGKERVCVARFSSVLMGTMHARRAAFYEASKMNADFYSSQL